MHLGKLGPQLYCSVLWLAVELQYTPAPSQAWMSSPPRSVAIFPTFLVAIFHQVHFCGPLYVAFSRVTLPLHRHIRLFTTTGDPFTPWTFLPPWAPPPPDGWFGGGLCQLWYTVWFLVALLMLPFHFRIRSGELKQHGWYSSVCRRSTRESYKLDAAAKRRASASRVFEIDTFWPILDHRW